MHHKKHPIADLVKAIDIYQLRTRLRVTFEYVLIKDLNDSVQCAKELCKLLRRFECNVNLIEYNPHPGCKFASSSKKSIELFARILEQAGIKVSIRLKRGRNIKAGCGQLGSGWLNNPQDKNKG